MSPKPTPPAILCHVQSGVADAALRGVLLGIEEEGVPVEVHRFDEANPLTLAHDAAIASRLGLGIGIAFDYIVITTDKLPESRPYIASQLGLSLAEDRISGSNAARIVKRIPLRGYRQERNH